MRARILLMAALGVPLACLLGVALYQLPPLHERFSWRVDTLLAGVKYALNPPGRQVFLPQEQQDLVAAIVQATLQAFTPSPTRSLTATPTALPATALVTSSSTPLPPTDAPTLSPTPLPPAVALTGIIHEYQKFNNCGPANLAMALSYWGWGGDQLVTRAYLRPSYAVDDKNVNPFEMVAFVETQTDFKALWRVGGDPALLKRLIAAGFPVIVEKGFIPPGEEWMGHFELVSGYDDPNQRFITQDSYIMPDFPLPYEQLVPRWRDFDFVYVVVYPPDRERQVLAVLGSDADPLANFQRAADQATVETQSLAGRDLYFAWFDLGTDLVALGDYPGAATAYDAAFGVYASLPESQRPWRNLWYQTGPYPAYYYTARYQDVIDLAHNTLLHVDKPVLEETYYWRGLAREALGDRDGAVADLTRAAQLNTRSTDALAQLQRLGIPFP
jgi:hypothetical protein